METHAHDISQLSAFQAFSMLEWYIEAGVNEAISLEPVCRLGMLHAPAPEPLPLTSTAARPAATVNTALSASPSAGAAKARELADAATTLDALREAVMSFDGCALKRIATHTVFADGAAPSDLMIIGDMPREDDDCSGQCFSGTEGALLNNILKAMQRNRDNTYLTHAVFWRPAGGLEPSATDAAMCEPFLEKHIALVRPKHIIAMGNTANKMLLKTSKAVAGLRTISHEYTNNYLEGTTIPVTVTFHPAYLLKNPLHKRLVWEDMKRVMTTLNP